MGVVGRPSGRAAGEFFGGLNRGNGHCRRQGACGSFALLEQAVTGLGSLLGPIRLVIAVSAWVFSGFLVVFGLAWTGTGRSKPS